MGALFGKVTESVREFSGNFLAELIFRWLGGLPGPSANHFQLVSNQKMVWTPWKTIKQTLENQWKCQKILGKPRPPSQKMVCRTLLQTILKMSFVFFRGIPGKSGRMACKGPKAKGSASEEVGTFEDPHFFCKIIRKKTKKHAFWLIRQICNGGIYF